MNETLRKFIKDKDNLNMILKIQRGMNDKA